MTKCPLCGAKVLYRGLHTLECTGDGCENRSKTYVPTQTVAELTEQLREDLMAWYVGP